MAPTTVSAEALDTGSLVVSECNRGTAATHINTIPAKHVRAPDHDVCAEETCREALRRRMIINTVHTSYATEQRFVGLVFSSSSPSSPSTCLAARRSIESDSTSQSSPARPASGGGGAARLRIDNGSAFTSGSSPASGSWVVVLKLIVKVSFACAPRCGVHNVKQAVPLAQQDRKNRVAGGQRSE